MVWLTQENKEQLLQRIKKMTEEEALNNWCPFGKNRSVTGFNDCGTPTHASALMSGEKISVTCIGSRCMAWRFDPYNIDAKLAGIKLTGYCGLAGRMETNHEQHF